LAVKAALLGLAALAAVALGGCERISPEVAACKGAASGDDQVQAKLAACEKVIASGARGDALEQALAARGEAYRQSSDFDHAIQDYDQALRLNPRDSTALNGRGVAYLNQDKADLALADFNAAIRANPEDGDAFDHRGYIERTRGAADAAIADESQAIELEPNASLPWANRGYDYAAKRQWDSAIADFDDALLRAPHNDDAFALQGRADAERGKGDAKAAIKDYDALLGDPHGDNALADAEAVVALSPPGDPDALNGRCWVRGVLDTQLPAALADCQQSLAVRPLSAQTLDSLAFIYFRQGRFDDAIKEYSAALAIDPKQTPSLFMRGVAKLRVGDPTGEDDIAAATSADKGIADQFASWGVKP
jgi:tetratricopeptide (TPR) repeat protein